MEPYNEREPQDVQILWGRVVALGAALLVAFLLGTWVAGGEEGIDEDEHLELTQERDRLARENEELQEQLDELSQAGRPEERPTTDEDDEEEDEDETDDAESQVYVVRQGDTLSQVAQRFYGSSGLEARERIAEANDMEPDGTLTVGQELTIPPADD